MKLIYIAGPFRAPTAWQVEQNVRSAEELGLVVAKLGALPVIPHANTRYFHGQCNEQFWLDGYLELLRRCDGVALLPGWENSVGTLAEIKEAGLRGIPSVECLEQSDVVGLIDLIEEKS